MFPELKTRVHELSIGGSVMRFTAEDKRVLITGRSLSVEGVRYLGYTASSVTFTFEGKKASACILSDADAWEDALKGYIDVLIDGEIRPYRRIRLDRREGLYELYESSRERRVTLTVIKTSEAPFGICGLRYMEIDTEKLLEPPQRPDRRLEIIGDSITCGYGVDAKNELEPFSTAAENPFKAYSLLTAAALGAQVHLVSWSGNGIISHYVEEDAPVPRDENLMPLVYRYTDISASQRLFGMDERLWEKWDFDRFRPDLVLVNLGTNDCSWCRDIAERKLHFQREYMAFLNEIREKNPAAEILCVLGTMDNRLIPQVQAAVRETSAGNNDTHLHFLSLPAQDPADGYGSDWHPSAKTHTRTAGILTAEIQRIMDW